MEADGLAPAGSPPANAHDLADLAPDPDALAPEASLDAVEAVLDQVDQALARLDDGTYGRCPSCDQPIDDARLAGDPTVVTCGQCADEVLVEVG
jgi:RNA polymerase-binding transcription factor DksA